MEKTLVILAAGMGSRFGGLKQIEPVGPNREIIADYSIYDALKCGFTKVVFVIKKENLEYFKSHIIAPYQDKIKVEFAFQSLAGFEKYLPPTRTKMLGTAHALYCAKDYVKEPFVMINADDFYGRESYTLAKEFIESSSDNYEYLSVNYPYNKSRSQNGKVNRGVVKLDENNNILDIDECSIEEVDGQVIATSKKDHTQQIIAEDALVSMNFLVFKPTIFDFLAADLKHFLAGNINDTDELILTDTIKNCLQNSQIKFKSVTTSSRWFGMTYREDIKDLQATLQELIKEGVYPKKLWEEE